jgi:hypothetical protein
MDFLSALCIVLSKRTTTVLELPRDPGAPRKQPWGSAGMFELNQSQTWTLVKFLHLYGLYILQYDGVPPECTPDLDDNIHKASRIINTY